MPDVIGQAIAIILLKYKTDEYTLTEAVREIKEYIEM